MARSAQTAGARGSRGKRSNAIAKLRSRGQLEEMATEASKGPASTRRRSRGWIPRTSRSCRETLHESDQAFEVTFAGEEGEDWLDEFRLDGESPEDQREERLGEVARLEGEIRDSRRRQDALERYVEALAAQAPKT